MARKWLNVPLDQKLNHNVDEASNIAMAAIENGFVNEFGHHERFPRLKVFALLSDPGRVYLHEWRNDLIASTSQGRFYRVTTDGIVQDRTGLVIPGGRRTIFAQTEDEVIMAAGGELVRFAGDRTEILDESGTAPKATHVAYLDGYVIAAEVDSGRFFHSGAGLGRQWNTLDTFAANGSPDNITSLLVTKYRELIVCGPQSTEQFERLSGGTLPFFRRWSVGHGVPRPYMATFADNAVWTFNAINEFIRFSGQSFTSFGDLIGKLAQETTDWTDAWIGGHPDRPLHISGQRFLIMQLPNRHTPYGTKGITLLFDYKLQRFYDLYGWDDARGVPTRWPGWSHWTIWDRHFVGGEGVIYELVGW